ncbi:hypothetical protein V8E51_013500 [Hyaloscypha variabilis]|jgi:hypothetical protein
MARGGNIKNGGRGGGRQGGNNKHCDICNKNGHNTVECNQNPNNKNKQNNAKEKGQANNGQGQAQGSKWCSNCNMKNHNTEDCSRGPKTSQSPAQSPPLQTQPQYPNQPQQNQTQPQIPDLNGVPTVFNDPCQLCLQRGHSARDCPSRHSYIPPQSGTYFPQTYPPPKIAPAYTPPQQQWQPSGAVQVPQQQWQGLGMVDEEVSTREQAPLSGYQAYQSYVPEVAVPRERNQDRDGDFVMEDAWY